MDDPIAQEFAVICALIPAYLEEAVQRGGLNQAQRRQFAKHIKRVRELAGEEATQRYVDSLVHARMLQAHAELLELLAQLESMAMLNTFDVNHAELVKQAKHRLGPPSDIKAALRSSFHSAPPSSSYGALAP